MNYQDFQKLKHLQDRQPQRLMRLNAVSSAFAGCKYPTHRPTLRHIGVRLVTCWVIISILPSDNDVINRQSYPTSSSSSLLSSSVHYRTVYIVQRTAVKKCATHDEHHDKQWLCGRRTWAEHSNTHHSDSASLINTIRHRGRIRQPAATKQ